MAILGFDVGLPDIDVGGFFSSSWVYVVIVAAIGLFLIFIIAILLYFSTYKRKVVVFENVSGLGYQPVLKTRARIIRFGKGGEEILKTLSGGYFISAYGKRMGKNTYWYAKGQDGYWYNIVLGDLDTKLAMLDIEPVDKDVRMFHAALEKLSTETYGGSNFLQKYGVQMMLLVFLLVMIVGFWVIAGKINEGLSAGNAAAEINLRTVELADRVLTKIDSVQRGGTSGLAPASLILPLIPNG